MSRQGRITDRGPDENLRNKSEGDIESHEQGAEGIERLSQVVAEIKREEQGDQEKPVVREKQPDGRYVVHISDSIIAKYTRMQGASVTYTPESWRYVNDRLAEMYPNDEAVIVGWYHTHPGFGIFLSGMDKFIHQNFFTQIWHIAMVLDPLAQQSGFFCWDRGMSKVDKYEFPWPVWASGSW